MGRLPEGSASLRFPIATMKNIAKALTNATKKMISATVSISASAPRSPGSDVTMVTPHLADSIQSP